LELPLFHFLERASPELLDVVHTGLWDNLEEWDGVGGRRETGGDICIPMADSC